MQAPPRGRKAAKCLLPILIVVVVGLLYGTWVANADRQTGSFTLDETRPEPLSKFGCSYKTCRYTFRFQLVTPKILGERETKASQPLLQLRRTDPVSVNLRVFLDTDWENVPVKRSPTCTTLQAARARHKIFLPLNATWSEATTGSLTQRLRPHMWYYTFDDCEGLVSNVVSSVWKIPKETVGPIKIRWESVLVQETGSYLSHEYKGSLEFTVIHIIAYTFVLCWILIREGREMKNSGRLHFILQMFNVCLTTQLSSTIIHLVYILQYKATGSGYSFWNLLCEGLSLTSQITIAVILILIGRGYSLTTGRLTSERSPISRLWPLTCVVTLIHLAIIVVDYWSANLSVRSHSGDSIVGPIFIVFRLGLWLLFLHSCVTTATRATTPRGTACFLRRFLFPGSLYFLAYPLVVVFASTLPRYMQHRLMSNGFFLMQLASLIWLSTLFLHRGDYFKASELSHSYLPGGYVQSGRTHLRD